MPPIIAWHFTDPACPWAYSARPAHARLAWRFGSQIEWRLVLIGLSETTERYTDRGLTPARMATGVRDFPKRFGMPFGAGAKPGMAATSRACRAIVAARGLDPTLGEAALRALQLMQFTTSGLLDQDDDLRAALARVPGLDAAEVVGRIDDPDVIAEYESDRAHARSAEGSPTHSQGRSSTSDGPVRYTAPSVIFEHRDGGRVEVGGFQPFESYDTALANLDTTLERRPPPVDPADALSVFPDGLTTAEVAAILRPSDLVDADLLDAEKRLTALIGDGGVICEPVAGDALWRLTRSAELSAGGESRP